MKFLSHVQLFVTPWTVTYQALLFMGFPRQGYWSGLPFPSPGDRPNPGIEPESPALQVDALPSEPPGKLSGWVTHTLESSNTKEAFPLLGRFRTPCHASRFLVWGPYKGTGTPRVSGLEGQQDLITRLPQDWGKQRFQSWRTQIKPCAHRDSEERSSDSTGN